jgi:hypothetical protein
MGFNLDHLATLVGSSSTSFPCNNNIIKSNVNDKKDLWLKPNLKPSLMHLMYFSLEKMKLLFLVISAVVLAASTDGAAFEDASVSFQGEAAAADLLLQDEGENAEANAGRRGFEVAVYNSVVVVTGEG